MEIGKRLFCISEFVKNGAKIADIGADHAKLPVYLMRKGKINYAVASDKNDGPLAAAKETVRRAGFSEKIDVRLGDGLKSLKPNEVDTIIIAGMGGNLITKILDDSKKILETVDNLILQPMNEAKTLRVWLINNNWRTENETLVKEDKKIYEIISAVKDENSGNVEDVKLNDVELLFGSIILRNKNELLRERIVEIIEKEKRKTGGMEKSENAKNSEEYFILKEELQTLEALLW